MALVSGSSVTVPSIISLQLPGMGMTVYGNPLTGTPAFFGVRETLTRTTWSRSSRAAARVIPDGFFLPLLR
jgi:hypothetical protein